MADVLGIILKYLADDGDVDTDSFTRAITRLDPTWTNEQLNILVDSFPLNEKGRIDKLDFKDWFRGKRGSVLPEAPRTVELPAVPGSLAELPDLSQSALKFDHFEAIYRLPVVIDGAPNFRHVKGDVPVYGTGQPTLDGYIGILNRLRDDGFNSVVWCNMRMEPVVYVNGRSFTPRKVCRNHIEGRHQCPMNQNLELPGVTAQQLQEVELQVVENKTLEFGSARSTNSFVQLIIAARARAGHFSAQTTPDVTPRGSVSGETTHRAILAPGRMSEVASTASLTPRESISEEPSTHRDSVVSIQDCPVAVTPPNRGSLASIGESVVGGTLPSVPAVSSSQPMPPGTLPGGQRLSVLGGTREPRLKKIAKAALAHRRSMIDGQFFKDTFAEHPDDRINHKHDIKLDEKFGGVKSILGMVNFLQLKGTCEKHEWPTIAYHRFPCADEKALPVQFFDELVTLLSAHCQEDGDSKPAIVFNCQMGKGRTTTGQIVATIIWSVLRSTPFSTEGVSLDHPAVHEMCASLPGCESAIALANFAIDTCDEMQNLRECVNWAWERHDLEGMVHKRKYWIGMAENFIQRYCFLVLFSAYCLECGVAPYVFTEPGVPFLSFAAFLDGHSALMEQLAELWTVFLGSNEDGSDFYSDVSDNDELGRQMS